MLLLDLPPELLVLVLKRYLHRHRRYHWKLTSSAALKANLRLLSICSALRQLSLPLVYKQLFFSHVSAPVSGADTADAAPDDHRRAKISTNLDLVVAVGGSHLVREVFTMTEFTATPSPALWWMIGGMRSVAPVWSRMDSLIMVTAHRQRATDLSEIEMGNVRADMLAVGDALVELMPGLRKLDFGENSTFPMIGEVSGRVAGCVAGQLLKLGVRGNIHLPEDFRLDAIRDLRIWNRATAGWLPPRIPADALERLDFVGWTNDDLRSFIDTNSGNNRNIVLHKLKSLKVWQRPHNDTNRSTADARQYHQRLRLPALRKLDIACPTAECLPWNSVVLPANMDSLDLWVTGAAYESIAQTTIPNVKRLHLKVHCLGTDASTTIRAIDRILAEAGGYESKTLLVMGGIIGVRPDSLACTDLTCLQLTWTTTVDDLLGFLQKHSRLRYLKLRYVTVEDIHADISIPGSDEERLVTPLNATLSKLEFTVAGGKEVRVKATALTKRLMLGLPALVNIEARPIPKRQIVDFVGEYVHRYPHLAGVDVQLIR